MSTDKNDLGEILKLRRLMLPLTLVELAVASDVSVAHLGRIEGGKRYPSARILRRIAKPLGFAEAELFTIAGYFTPQPSTGDGSLKGGRLDPYVAGVISQEPVEIQFAVVAILSILKRLYNVEFAEYAHRKYPELDEDLITMIADIMEHHPKG